jgi:2-dehydro-3-deoxygluconokinase
VTVATPAKFDIVSLGEPLYEFAQIPGEGRKYLQGFGGDTSNAAIAAARQGATVAYVTRLGDDEFGKQFMQLWREEGIDTSGVGIDPEAHSGVYFIHYEPEGHVFSYLRAGSAASRMRPEDLPLGSIRATRFLHVSAISQAISASACDTVFAAIEAAKAAGAKFCYDSNLRLGLWPLTRAKAVIAGTIPLADYFLPSLDDVKALSGRDAPEAIVEWAHGLGARQVALKLGSDGALASDGTRIERLKPHQVACVDATGAGDCFAGSLLARLARGDDFWKAARYANAAAALTTTGYGAVAPLPRPMAVQALLDTAGDP